MNAQGPRYTKLVSPRKATSFPRVISEVLKFLLSAAHTEIAGKRLNTRIYRRAVLFM